MKVVDRNFKSFFALIQKAKSGLYQFNQIRLPHYLDKDGYFSIPMSREFKKENGELKFNIPPNIADKEIKEVRIHPKNNVSYFEIEYIYIQPEFQVELDNSKFLSVDLGLDNLASCVTSEVASFIIDGKKIKSYNRLYNKENARLQSIKDKQKIKGYTSKQYNNLRKRKSRNVYLCHS